MAKRKRLTPAQPGFLSAGADPALGRGPMAPPIAQVAGDAAAAAAFHDVAEELGRARDEGRLVQALPLDQVQDAHLVRDRIGFDPAEMAALKASLQARGQQSPIEVVALPGGGYGLVSGWRRLRALRDLAAETGEARFGTVLALLRRPDSDAAAYVAMVEENEIRADLSFYERARIVRQAVKAGVFETDQMALTALFAAASAPKRSKIKSFLRVVDELGDVLRYPVALSEHLGLKLVKALGQDPALPARIAAALAERDPQDAASEIALLQDLLAPPVAPAPAPKKVTDQGGTEPVSPAPLRVAGPIIPGLTLSAERGEVVLRGQRVTDDFVTRLEAFLRDLER